MNLKTKIRTKFLLENEYIDFSSQIIVKKAKDMDKGLTKIYESD